MVLHVYHCIMLLFTTPMALPQRNDTLKISIYILVYYLSESEIPSDDQFNMKKQFLLSLLPDP